MKRMQSETYHVRVGRPLLGLEEDRLVLAALSARSFNAR